MTDCDDRVLRAVTFEREEIGREIDALRADNAALRKDAERYRWLRDKSVPPHNFYISVPDEFKDVHYAPAQVDAAIDAAMLAGKSDALEGKQ